MSKQPPDVKKLRNDIKTMKKFINKLEKKGKKPYDIEVEMTKKLPDLYKSYPFIAKSLCKKEDETPLKIMLSELEKVQNGKQTLEDTEKRLGNELANKYVYPKIKKNDTTKD